MPGCPPTQRRVPTDFNPKQHQHMRGQEGQTDVAIDPQEWYGNGVVDIDGAKLGKIHDIYLDTSTDQPQWLAVKIGAVVALVPFTGAQPQGNVMRVAYTTDRIQEAPTVDDAESLSHDDEDGLYRHYGP